MLRYAKVKMPESTKKVPRRYQNKKPAGINRRP